MYGAVQYNGVGYGVEWYGIVVIKSRFANHCQILHLEKLVTFQYAGDIPF